MQLGPQEHMGHETGYAWRHRRGAHGCACLALQRGVPPNTWQRGGSAALHLHAMGQQSCNAVWHQLPGCRGSAGASNLQARQHSRRQEVSACFCLCAVRPHPFSLALLFLRFPLSHYFISSGHNSYLTADQLVGSSGTATIVRVRWRRPQCHRGSVAAGKGAVQALQLHLGAQLE